MPRRSTTRLIIIAALSLAGTLAASAQDATAPGPGAAGSPPGGAPAALTPAAATPAAGGKAMEASQELQRGNTAKAIAAYTEALKDTGLANDRRATLLNDRAVAYAKAGEIKFALEDYNRAVQLAAEYPPAYNNRGNLLVAIGQPTEAIKDFDRAILLAPAYAAAYSNRANARLKLGQTADAVRDFTRAIELMPQSAPPLSGRGLAHLSSGKPHAAIRDFSRAVNADARFASAYRNRAEARISVGQQDEAIEDLSRAAAFDINNAELYLVRGYAYLDAGNAPSAIKDFTRAIELAPNAASGHQARGLANGIAEAYEEAYTDLNRAIELDPRSAAAFAYRAYVYKQAQRLDVAEKDIETAVKLAPARADVLWASGELEEARGRADAAVAAYRNALAADPGWKLADTALKRLGVADDAAEDKVVAGGGTGSWRVVMRKNAYFAVSDDYPQVRIALEMMGEGAPKLLEWELKKAPYKGYGVLRFASGRVLGKSGPEDTEQAAIVDIENAKVLAIQPSRQGQRVATWTWEDDRVQVASIDGVTDEFALRSVKAEAEAPLAAAPAPRRAAPAARQPAGWSPWDTPFGQPQAERREQRRQATTRRHQPKPKSLFDLIFN